MLLLSASFIERDFQFGLFIFAFAFSFLLIFTGLLLLGPLALLIRPFTAFLFNLSFADALQRYKTHSFAISGIEYLQSSTSCLRCQTAVALGDEF